MPSNREVAHLWAAQSRPSARGSHFYFEGATIYSYGPHFPIARIYARKVKGALFEKDNPACRLVLFSNDSYSMTTAKHQSYTRAAVSHLPVIAVPYIGAGAKDDSAAGRHSENLAVIAARVGDAVKSAARRMSADLVIVDRERARDAIADFARYCAFFGIRRKAPAFPAADFQAAEERARRIENPDPASADKRERARAKRNRANRERDEYLAEQRRSMAAAKRARDFWRIGAARTNWRLYGAFDKMDYEALRSSDCMLCVNGEQIETSWGAKVPLAAAPMVWNLVQRARAADGRNVEWNRRLKIGDYPLDRIDADGTLRAGCHTIPYSELASMARALGLQS